MCLDLVLDDVGVEYHGVCVTQGGGASVVIDGQAHGTTPMTAALNAGPHTIELSNTDGVHRTMTVNVTWVKASTTTSLTSSTSSSTYGNSVTFTATVSPQYSGSPTGTETFSIPIRCGFRRGRN